MELAIIVQMLVAGLSAVLWYLLTQQSKKHDALALDYLNYKTHVAEVYATQPQLTRAIELVNKTVEGMAAGVSRIEERLYQINNSAQRT